MYGITKCTSLDMCNLLKQKVNFSVLWGIHYFPHLLWIQRLHGDKKLAKLPQWKMSYREQIICPKYCCSQQWNRWRISKVSNCTFHKSIVKGKCLSQYQHPYFYELNKLDLIKQDCESQKNYSKISKKLPLASNLNTK